MSASQIDLQDDSQKEDSRPCTRVEEGLQRTLPRLGSQSETDSRESRSNNNTRVNRRGVDVFGIPNQRNSAKTATAKASNMFPRIRSAPAPNSRLSFSERRLFLDTLASYYSLKRISFSPPILPLPGFWRTGIQLRAKK